MQIFSPHRRKQFQFSNKASLAFDGVDEYIDFGDNYDFGPATPFSVSMWIKPTNLLAQRVLISKTSADANVFGWVLYHNASGTPFIQVRAPSQLRSFTFSLPLTAGAWQHIALTYTGGSNLNGFRVYVNSTVDATPPSQVITNAWDHTTPLFIGQRSTSFFYTGSMNQVSIWDKALSQAEINEVYGLAKPLNLAQHSAAANILSWWGLSDGVNFPTEDDLTNTVDGTLTNMEVGDYTPGDVP